MPIPVLTAGAMRQADRETIDSFGIPGFTLMESAGRAAAEAILELLDAVQGESVLVLCGKGNNGGDGLVIARQLVQFGCAVDVVLLGTRESVSEDARANLDLLSRLADRDESAEIDISTFREWNRDGRPGRWDLIVDALLGTGLQRNLEDPIRSLVDWINDQDVPVMSVDMPTGLDTDRGIVHGSCVKADLTVTMGALKVGQLINDGPEHVGALEVAEIGIPDFILDTAASASSCAWLVMDDEVSSWLPARARDAHKYSAGMVLAAVGSTRYTGAAVMSSLAALRIGAGYVVAAVPAGIKATLGEHLVEVTLEALPETVDGAFAESAFGSISERLSKAQSLLVGCGVGRDPETMAFIRELVASTDTPGVLDADGLYAIAGHLDILKKAPGKEWILTPHWGEFGRLVGKDEVDKKDIVTLASRYARVWGCVLILKGLPSLVGCPDGRVYINATGNPALATAGTGDVLAGICAGLLAQGLAPEQAAVAGLHIGGAAADRYAESRDERTMIASDLIQLLPETIAERF